MEINEPILLVADRNEELLQHLARAGRSRGMRVITAHDEAELVLRANEVRPDVVMIELDLPGLGGIELCRMLREAPGTEDISVILRGSRWLTSDTLRKAIDAGANDLVERSCPLQALLDRIQGHVGLAAPAAPLPFLWGSTACDELRTVRVHTVDDEVLA